MLDNPLCMDNLNISLLSVFTNFLFDDILSPDSVVYSKVLTYTEGSVRFLV